MVKNAGITAEEVLSTNGYFRIIKNGTLDYKLFKKMTSSMDQNEHAKYYEKAKKEGNPRQLNSFQHYNLFRDAIKSGNSDLVNYVQKGFQKWPITLSRIVYEPFGEENKTIHNYGTSDAYSTIATPVAIKDFIKNEGWKCISNSNSLESLSEKESEMFNKVFNTWKSNPMYFSPKTIHEMVITFLWLNSDDGDELLMEVSKELSYRAPAFLVEQIK